MLKIETKILSHPVKNVKELTKANNSIEKEIQEYMSFFKDSLVDYNVSSDTISLDGKILIQSTIVLRHRSLK